MFEGKSLRPGDARPLDAEPWDDEVLRPLSWSELVARLSAARDLRASFEVRGEGGEASFDAGSARRIAAHHNGKHDVNLDVSGNGKAAAGTALRTPPGDEPAATRE
jgi:hypothetical protein